MPSLVVISPDTGTGTSTGTHGTNSGALLFSPLLISGVNPYSQKVPGFRAGFQIINLPALNWRLIRINKITQIKIMILSPFYLF